MNASRHLPPNLSPGTSATRFQAGFRRCSSLIRCTSPADYLPKRALLEKIVDTLNCSPIQSKALNHIMKGEQVANAKISILIGVRDWRIDPRSLEALPVGP